MSSSHFFLTSSFDSTFIPCLLSVPIASAISSLDYLSEVNWVNYEKVKNWYAAIKSRPSFKEILEESIYNIAPAAHYKDLDF